MKLTTTNRSSVDEAPYGTYVYQCEDGEFLGDGDGNLMCILGAPNDAKKVRKMIEAAKHYGFTNGKVVFWNGKRPVSDAEYEEQRLRQMMGLVPDPLDIGAIRDENRRNAKYGIS